MFMYMSFTEPPSILFQLKLGGVGHCSKWLLKVSIMKTTTTNNVKGMIYLY